MATVCEHTFDQVGEVVKQLAGNVKLHSMCLSTRTCTTGESDRPTPTVRIIQIYKVIVGQRQHRNFAHVCITDSHGNTNIQHECVIELRRYDDRNTYQPPVIDRCNFTTTTKRCPRVLYYNTMSVGVWAGAIHVRITNLCPDNISDEECSIQSDHCDKLIILDHKLGFDEVTVDGLRDALAK